MKTPTWAIVIAIVMLLFGGCGLSGHIQQIVSPTLVNMERDVSRHIDSMEKAKGADSVTTVHSKKAGDTTVTVTTTTGPGFPQEFNESAKKTMHLSNQARTWITRFSYIGLFVCLMYLLGGLFLLVKRPFSIRLAYVALILSLLAGLAQAILLLQDKQSGLFVHMYGIGKVAGVVIDIVLLIVVALSDKTAYRPVTETTTHE